MIHCSVPHSSSARTAHPGWRKDFGRALSICLIVSSNVSNREGTSSMVHLTFLPLPHMAQHNWIPQVTNHSLLRGAQIFVESNSYLFSKIVMMWFLALILMMCILSLMNTNLLDG